MVASGSVDGNSSGRELQHSKGDCQPDVGGRNMHLRGTYCCWIVDDGGGICCLDSEAFFRRKDCQRGKERGCCYGGQSATDGVADENGVEGINYVKMGGRQGAKGERPAWATGTARFVLVWRPSDVGGRHRVGPFRLCSSSSPTSCSTPATTTKTMSRLSCAVAVPECSV